MENFLYKGTSVGVTHYNTGNLPQHLRRSCFCCNQEMNKDDVVLLINNQVHFPNTLIHESCWEEWKNKTDMLCTDIESAYQRYEKLDKVFGNLKG